MRCGDVPNAAAAPATVSGELSAHLPLDFRVREGEQDAMIRKPGDLPLVVVTREHIGRGVLVGLSVVFLRRRPNCVRGDVPRYRELCDDLPYCPPVAASPRAS